MNKAFGKTIILALLVSTLLWVAACATGSGPTGTSYGSSFGPEQSDPEFWQIWSDMHGGGG